MERLYRLACTPAGARLISWLLTHVSFLIPAQRLYETATLVAFYHPRPSYPLHILLLPKRRLASLADLTPADADFMTDLFSTVQHLVHELDLAPAGYRLIANGGAYQDVPHLHFHLVAGR
ncbi:MAG: HIT domain-containing protein [Ardenticatenaceae bacterium]|nr:HIT domain-containing protein [Anaerolineales bacterium]MCB8918730.1 HIT domain-containing protein [Ardenticatenaceae bacterium]